MDNLAVVRKKLRAARFWAHVTLLHYDRNCWHKTGRLKELSFAKIPSGLNPFAISAISKPGNKNPTR
jgi:hypothetical protein